MHKTESKLNTADGGTLAVTRFAGEHAQAGLILAPALGIPQRFYTAFAEWLADHGVCVWTFDYRGIGQSHAGCDGAQVRMTDWIADVGQTITHARHQSPDLPLFVLGHSIGTQLWCLPPEARELSGAIWVAASAPHASHWRGAQQLGLHLLWRALVPALSVGRNRFPARRLGLSGVNVPTGLIRDWARYARSPRYLFNPQHGLNLDTSRSLRVPVLSLEFTDDGFAPEATTAALIAELPGLTVERRRITPDEYGVKAIGHSGFFRAGAPVPLWEHTLAWLRSH